MIQVQEEKFLLATEVAKHLGISRIKFYVDYKHCLEPVNVGQMRRKYYRMSDVDRVHCSIRPVQKAS